MRLRKSRLALGAAVHSTLCMLFSSCAVAVVQATEKGVHCKTAMEKLGCKNGCNFCNYCKNDCCCTNKAHSSTETWLFDLQASRSGKKREDGAVSGATLVSLLCCKETTRTIHPLHTKPSWNTNADARPNKRQGKQWNPSPVKRHAPTAGLRQERHSAAFVMSQIEAWVSESSYINWQWRASVPTHDSGREQWAEKLTYRQIYLFCFFKTWKMTIKKEPFGSYIIAPSPRGIRTQLCYRRCLHPACQRLTHAVTHMHNG